MVNYKGKEVAEAGSVLSHEECRLEGERLVVEALNKARKVIVFTGRWKAIVLKLEKIPDLISELSSHSRNEFCLEQLQAVLKALNDVIELGELCIEEKFSGKLQMQSDLDALTGRLDLILRDCDRLIKTGLLLGEVSSRESLFARLQIGNLEAKNRVLDCLVDDLDLVSDDISRGSINGLVQLLTTATTSSPRIREKAVMIICSLAECGGKYDNWLVSEGVVEPLVRVLESSGTSPMCKQKAAITLQKLSVSDETARLIVDHNGIGPLLVICQTQDDSVSQAASACVLKNISVIPELRQTLHDKGIVKVMISLLDSGMSTGSKQYAAECLKNLTSGKNESLKRNVLAEGGLNSLLTFLEDGPQESAVSVLRNLIGLVPVNDLISHKIVIRLIRVLESGSLQAQIDAGTSICRICSDNTEMKRIVGENGGITFLVKMLESKSNGVREVAAQGLYSLMMLPRNSREVKKDDKSVVNLVLLLLDNNGGYENTVAKKYAVSCLLLLCSSKKCRKLMVDYGVIGVLKKLSDINGANKLLEKLEKGKLKRLFGRKK